MLTRRLLLGSGLAMGAASALAAPPPLPPGYPKGLYDEDLVRPYKLPELLVSARGQPIRTARQWTSVRRPELLALFSSEVYGRTPIARPPGMRWAVVSTDHDEGAVRKQVRIALLGRSDGPLLDIQLSAPPHRAPVFISPSPKHDAAPYLARGYALATFNPGQLMADRADAPYAGSLRQLLAPPGQSAPKDDDWGAIGVWAWGASRVLDYLQSDREVDAAKSAVMGVSRFGKTAMWAGAQDPRFAIVISSVSGTGGATIVRRGYGETVRAITNGFPYWFARRFAAYADRLDALPVDWHMLIALMAPRPVYIATAEEDYWNDAHGQFLAAKAAEPAYALFNERGLGVDAEPPLETPVGDFIGWHKRRGGHGLTAYDLDRFFDFADRRLGRK